MAQPTAPKPNPTTAAPNQGGRPKKQKPEGTPQERARANLQYTLDRACNFIHDGTASYARRARTAARAEVPKEVVLKGLEAMKAAIADAYASVERAYNAPQKNETPKSRVAL